MVLAHDSTLTAEDGERAVQDGVMSGKDDLHSASVEPLYRARRLCLPCQQGCWQTPLAVHVGAQQETVDAHAV